MAPWRGCRGAPADILADGDSNLSRQVSFGLRKPVPGAAQVVARGASARVAPLDVADARAVQAAADEIAQQEGRLDVLVNSAGLNVRERN